MQHPASPRCPSCCLLYQFVAQAVSDFKLQSLGDTINLNAAPSLRLAWEGSAAGPRVPADPVNGVRRRLRVKPAGWRPSPGGPDTYYSLRFSSSRPNTAHTHDDGGALTFYSRGVEWIGDPGPYRYENGSSLRWFMKSRAAHSSFTVSNVRRATSNGVRKLTSTSDWTLGGNDTVPGRPHLGQRRRDALHGSCAPSTR